MGHVLGLHMYRLQQWWWWHVCCLYVGTYNGICCSSYIQTGIGVTPTRTFVEWNCQNNIISSWKQYSNRSKQIRIRIFVSLMRTTHYYARHWTKENVQNCWTNYKDMNNQRPMRANQTKHFKIMTSNAWNTCRVVLFMKGVIKIMKK